MAERKEHQVGAFTAHIPIVVRREIEVGIAWEAEAIGLGLAAMGSTPKEAVRGLFSAIGDRGVAGNGHADEGKLAKLVEHSTEGEG